MCTGLPVEDDGPAVENRWLILVHCVVSRVFLPKSLVERLGLSIPVAIDAETEVFNAR